MVLNPGEPNDVHQSTFDEQKICTEIPRDNRKAR